MAPALSLAQLEELLAPVPLPAAAIGVALLVLAVLAVLRSRTKKPKRGRRKSSVTLATGSKATGSKVVVDNGELVRRSNRRVSIAA